MNTIYREILEFFQIQKFQSNSLKIHWWFCKLHSNFEIIWLPESENHSPCGHCILEALRYQICKVPV